MQVDLNKIENRAGVNEVHEDVGVWEFRIEGFEEKLKIKVYRTTNSDFPYWGRANFRVKNSKQASPYLAVNSQKTIDDAIIEALSGFLLFHDPNDPGMQYIPVEDW